MEALVWETAEELDMKLAQRVRNIRRRRKISQEELSRMSGVSYGSVKRFEATGKISLLSLTKLAMALDMADELRRSEEHTSELQSRQYLVCRLLLEKRPSAEWPGARTAGPYPRP